MNLCILDYKSYCAEGYCRVRLELPNRTGVCYTNKAIQLDLLAQLGEHLGDNQEVGSSSLPQITSVLKDQGLQQCNLGFFASISTQKQHE